MSIGLFFVFLMVMAFSFLIAANSRQCSLEEDSKTFLFGGNSSPLAISSNVGSLLSLSIIFSLFAVGMHGYGFATLFSTLGGICAAYFTFYRCRHRLHANVQLHKEDRLLTTHLNSEDTIVLNRLVIAQYIVALVCEFAVLQNFLRGFEKDFPSFAFLSGLMIVILCAAYIIVGGYSGVLRTDVFQMLIFTGACLLFVPVLLSVTGPIVEAVRDEKAWCWPPWVGPVTWFTFTYATFLAFPDVWVRNFGTLSNKKFSNSWFFPASLALLLLALVPIVGLTCFGAESIGKFDRRYDVQGAFDFYRDTFISGTVHGLGKWLIAAAFICVFITTIDTWLIGILQYSDTSKRNSDASTAIILLLAAGTGAVTFSHFMSGEWVYVLGLFLFPFIYLNTLLFFSKMKSEWSEQGAWRRYVFGWSFGMIGTCTSIALRWNDKEDFAPNIILLGMLSQFVAFAIFPKICKLLTPDEKTN